MCSCRRRVSQIGPPFCMGVFKYVIAFVVRPGRTMCTGQDYRPFPTRGVIWEEQALPSESISFRILIVSNGIHVLHVRPSRVGSF